VGKAFKKGVKAVGKAVKKGASWVCRKALGALAATMRGLCEAPIRLARGVLKGAQGVLRAAQAAFNVAVSIVRTVMNKVKEVVKFLSEIQLLTAGFKMQSTRNPKVVLKLSLRMSKKVQRYSITFDMKGCGSIMCMAKELVKQICKKIADAALGFISKLKKKLRLEEETMRTTMAKLESEMDWDVREAYMEAMDAAEKSMMEEAKQVRAERSRMLGDSSQGKELGNSGAVTCRGIEGIEGLQGDCYADWTTDYGK